MRSEHIRPGDLHHRAVLQSKSEVADGGGGVAISWVTDRNLWCLIRAPSGLMAQEAMQRQSEIKNEIIARYNADLTTKKRILHDGIAYLIEAVLRRGLRKEFVHMLAGSGVAT